MVCESLCLCIVACAFNPIDPIPDFIPIPRYLDEFIITPFALMLAVKCIPESVMTDAKIKTQQRKRNTGTPKFRTAVSGFSACTDSVLDFLILALILRPDDLCIRSDLRHFHRIMARTDRNPDISVSILRPLLGDQETVQSVCVSDDSLQSVQARKPRSGFRK